MQNSILCTDRQNHSSILFSCGKNKNLNVLLKYLFSQAVNFLPLLPEALSDFNVILVITIFDDSKQCKHAVGFLTTPSLNMNLSWRQKVAQCYKLFFSFFFSFSIDFFIKSYFTPTCSSMQLLRHHRLNLLWIAMRSSWCHYCWLKMMIRMSRWSPFSKRLMFSLWSFSHCCLL